MLLSSWFLFPFTGKGAGSRGHQEGCRGGEGAANCESLRTWANEETSPKEKLVWAHEEAWALLLGPQSLSER